MEKKIKVYVSSFEISTLNYVDKDSIGHPCVTSRHGDNIFTKFKHLPKRSWNGYLTDDQMKAVDIVCEFCKENRLEYEIVDITNASFVNKMKLVLRGVKAPTISFKGRKIEGIPTKENLKTLTSE